MSSALPTAFERGDLIAGRYELDEVLGCGSMGVVWRARNTALDSYVAVKILHPSRNTATLRERLLLEGKAAAQVGHLSIVKVFDIGAMPSGEPFIVMELLRGESLGMQLSRVGRLAPTDAVRLLLPIAEALQIAHKKGLIHRDVKPDNIFITEEPGGVRPKLVDFGIVKVQHRTEVSHLTDAGTVVGSPDYMSPEQARGQDNIDQLSDVWSFGIVLYELIAGEAPFRAANYNALLRLIVEQEPLTLYELAAADRRLSDIVSQCLRKPCSRRFASMAALGNALAQWLVSQGIEQDICGTSLESRWTTRPPPAAKPRASRRSATLGVGRARPAKALSAAVSVVAAVVAGVQLLGYASGTVGTPSRSMSTPQAMAVANLVEQPKEVRAPLRAHVVPTSLRASPSPAAPRAAPPRRPGPQPVSVAPAMLNRRNARSELLEPY